MSAEEHLKFLATLPPLPCREDLAALAQTYFVRTGRAAEIGVYQGRVRRDAADAMLPTPPSGRALHSTGGSAR